MRANTPLDVWRFIDVRGEDDCWEWTATRDDGGYGRIGIARKYHPAHRVVFQLVNGPINPDFKVCHHCDNRGCCNPKHLFVGTQADNVRDMVQKGRRASTKGERNPNRKLSAQQVLDARWIHSKGIAVSEVAKLYGLSWTAAKRAITGETWGA